MSTYDSMLIRLGGRIRACRVARGMTQNELAAAAGISARWLSAIERGKAKRLTIGDLHAIFGPVGMPAAEWFGAANAEDERAPPRCDAS